MADKSVTLHDENNNNLYPTTLYNLVKDANGNTLPSSFSDINNYATVATQVTTNQTNITNIQSEISHIQAVYDSQAYAITTMYNNINSLDGRVTTLENSGGGGGGSSTGETIDVVYDMNSQDSNINHGFTSGMTYGNTVQTDFSAYSKVRIFAKLNKNEVQLVYKTANRLKSDLNMVSINSTFNTISFLRLTAPTGNTAIQVGNYGMFDFDVDTGTFTRTKGSTNANFYLYRIEGIY